MKTKTEQFLKAMTERPRAGTKAAKRAAEIRKRVKKLATPEDALPGMSFTCCTGGQRVHFRG